MIIKSHIRGGYRAAADYMKDIGKNETTRLVEMSDDKAKDLDEMFLKMWQVTSCTQCKKPLHHISINPMKDERLTDKQVRAIADRCEEVYGYKMFHHQRVIIEHVKDGRQHFHVIWNRVSLVTGTIVWPGHHWKKSKQVAREMEKELGLKSPKPRSAGAKTKRRSKGTRTYKKGVRTRPITSQASKSATRPVGVFILNAPRTKTQETKPTSPNAPIATRPNSTKKRWPRQAVIDWEIWGHENPRWFFVIWPELAM